jgi:hypothetical protein
MFNLQQALYAASILNVQFDNFTPEEFLEGINIELEHGLINSKTNVTNNNLITTAKIALAHLNEFPNYYNKEYGLPALEKTLKEKLASSYREIPTWK